MDEPRYHLKGVVHAKAELMEDFDGPLDVILLLLSKNKIEIADLSIASILEQYLAYLDEMKRMDMEIASEFIAMASHLMLIKTKMLLSYSEQQEARSEMELLIASLEQRQRQEALSQIQKAADFLQLRNGLGSGCFVKGPEPLKRERRYQYQHTPEDLLRAVLLLAERTARSLPPPVSNFSGIVGKEPYPVTKKAAQVLGQLKAHGAMPLHQLFLGSRSRSEMVAVFLALLELCRQKSVALREDAGQELTVCLLQEPEVQEEEASGESGTGTNS